MPATQKPDTKTIQSFFNAISPQYDFLNTLLSFGLDGMWRARTAKVAIEGSERSILDLGVGTGKSLEAFLKAHHFERAVGCDFSVEMLKEAKARFGDRAEFVACDFHELSFEPSSFDLVTGSFILRSVQDRAHFYEQVKRILADKRKAVFLELTRPKNILTRKLLFEPYLKFYIPKAGHLFSNNEDAYRFLSDSILAFPSPEELTREMQQAGFVDVRTIPLHMGLVTILEGRKQS